MRIGWTHPYRRVVARTNLPLTTPKSRRTREELLAATASSDEFLRVRLEIRKRFSARIEQTLRTRAGSVLTILNWRLHPQDLA